MLEMNSVRDAVSDIYTTHVEPLHHREFAEDGSAIEEKYEDEHHIGLRQWFEENVADVLINYPQSLATWLAVLIILELMSVSTYVWAVHREAPWHVADPMPLDEFRMSRSTFVLQSVLCLWFTLTYLGWTLAGSFRTRIMTFQSLVSLATSIPMNVISIGAIINYEAWGGGYVPLFLRVWWLFFYVKTLLNVPQFGFRKRIPVDFALTIARFLCIVFTCAGLMHLSQSMTDKYMNFFDGLYFSIVTFSTAGYGDFTPTSRISRAIVMFFISFAVIYVPGVVNKSTEMALMRKRFTRYHEAQHVKHLVVIGNITPREMNIVLREFFSGKFNSKALSNIVFMNPNGFDAETSIFFLTPRGGRKLVPIHGDPSSDDDLDRCRIDEADAVFVVCDRSKPSGRGDFDVINTTWKINSRNPEVPVFAMLLHAKNSFHIQHRRTTTFEVDELRFSLLGQSALCPGLIPLIVNLIRTQDEADADEKTSIRWVNEYRQSRLNSIRCGNVPALFVGIPFLAAMVIMKKRHNVTFIGIATNNAEGKRVVRLNPKLYRFVETDEIIYIGTEDVLSNFKVPSWDLFDKGQWRTTVKAFVKRCEGLLGGAEEDHWSRSEAGAGAAAFHRGRRGTINQSVAITGGADLDAHNPYTATNIEYDDSRKGRVTSGGALSPMRRNRKTLSRMGDLGTEYFVPSGRTHQETYIFISEQELLENDHPMFFKDHILVVDSSCFTEKPALSPTESLDDEEFQNRELWDLLLGIKRLDPTEIHDIVVLSRTKFSEDFCNRWQQLGVRPVYIVEGSGLDMELLERMNVVSLQSAVVLSNGRARSEYEDTLTAIVCQNIRQILDTGARRYVPIICDVQEPDKLYSMPPVSDKYEFRSTHDDYTMFPKFVIGEALGSTMLDGALFQGYTNKYVVETVKRLVLGSAIPTVPKPLTPDNSAPVGQDPYEASSDSYSTVFTKESTHIGSKLLTELISKEEEMSEVFIELAHTGRILLGVYRQIGVKPEEKKKRPGIKTVDEGDDDCSDLHGYKYMLTNPRILEAVVYPTDVAFYLN